MTLPVILLLQLAAHLEQVSVENVVLTVTVCAPSLFGGDQQSTLVLTATSAIRVSARILRMLFKLLDRLAVDADVAPGLIDTQLG